MATRKPKKRPAKILVRKGEQTMIGDKLVRCSKRAVLTITDVDKQSERNIS
jgi:hypothetical protein